MVRARRRRAAILLEALVAVAFGLIVVGVLCEEIVRQESMLAAAREESRVHAALISAYERLRAGDLPIPEPGKRADLSAAGRVHVTLERSSAPLDARLSGRGTLVSVVLRATWRDRGGRERERTLATLVPGGAP